VAVRGAAVEDVAAIEQHIGERLVGEYQINSRVAGHK